MSHLEPLLTAASEGQLKTAQFEPSPRGLWAALEVGALFNVNPRRVVKAFLEDFLLEAGLDLEVELLWRLDGS